MQPNLNICQTCQKEPATYGDGLTWSRCSACQLKFTQKEESTIKVPMDEEGFEHKIIPGLISIIMPVYIINYPLFHYTGNAIGSIREHTNKEKTPYELIIIDNGSTIKPPSPQSYYADKIVIHSQNLGVSIAWNKGVRVSFGEYIVIINNDVQVFEGWLETLKEVLDSGEADLVMAHPMYSLTEPFARAIESKKVLEGKSIFDSIGTDFSCVMFKKELYNEIGAFDETFFAYCQDIDFLKRMEVAGKKYKVVDKVAIHHISDATGASIPETPEIMNEDKAKYEEKWKAGELQDQINEQLREVVEDIEEKVVEQIQTEIRFIRTPETGDKVYLKTETTIHWVKNPETYEALGGKFGNESIVSKEEFAQFERGEPIDMGNVGKYA